LSRFPCGWGGGKYLEREKTRKKEKLECNKERKTTKHESANGGFNSKVGKQEDRTILRHLRIWKKKKSRSTLESGHYIKGKRKKRKTLKEGKKMGGKRKVTNHIWRIHFV